MKEIVRIGFAGKMGTGKTTAANELERVLRAEGKSTAHIPLKFADPIYEVLRVLHRWEDEGKPRAFMQKFGDVAREEFGDDIFERLFEEKYFTAEMDTEVIPYKRVLITVDDVRHENELILLRNLGFYIIGLECPLEVRQKRINFIDSSHRSETELDDLDELADVKIVNDGDIEELAEILKMTSHFMGWSGNGFTKISHQEREGIPEEGLQEDSGYIGSINT